jgi:hypothetical protein
VLKYHVHVYGDGWAEQVNIIGALQNYKEDWQEKVPGENN